MKKLRLMLVLLVLSLLLFSAVAGGTDAEADCLSYCQTAWPNDPAQYQVCLEDCAR